MKRQIPEYDNLSSEKRYQNFSLLLFAYTNCKFRVAKSPNSVDQAVVASIDSFGARPTAGTRPARLMLYTTPAADRAASIKHESKQPRIKRRHKKKDLSSVPIKTNQRAYLGENLKITIDDRVLRRHLLELNKVRLQTHSRGGGQAGEKVDPPLHPCPLSSPPPPSFLSTVPSPLCTPLSPLP